MKKIFKYSFQGTLYLTCNCGEDIGISSHYLLPCPDYLQEIMTPLNVVRCIDPNILDLSNSQLGKSILNGQENLNLNNRSILDATIKHLIETN